MTSDSWGSSSTVQNVLPLLPGQEPPEQTIVVGTGGTITNHCGSCAPIGAV